LAQLRDLDEDVRLGPSTGSIVNAAVARSIPYSRMTEGSMVRFGWGSKQRRIQAAEMDLTSAIAEAIAQDKELTKKLLAGRRRAGAHRARGDRRRRRLGCRAGDRPASGGQAATMATRAKA